MELALHRPPDGIVLYSPFTSLADMGAALYTFSPVRLLAGNRLDSLARIGQYQGPLLVIHGEADEIIPIEQGRALYDAAPGPKYFYQVPGAYHNDRLSDAGPGLWAALDAFLLSLPCNATITDRAAGSNCKTAE